MLTIRFKNDKVTCIPLVGPFPRSIKGPRTSNNNKMIQQKILFIILEDSSVNKVLLIITTVKTIIRAPSVLSQPLKFKFIQVTLQNAQNEFP